MIFRKFTLLAGIGILVHAHTRSSRGLVNKSTHTDLHTTAPQLTTMAVVQVYVQHQGEWVRCYGVRLNVVNQHLRAISRALSERAPDERRDVYLSGVTRGPLTFVLDELHEQRKALHLNLHLFSLPYAIAVWQAVEVLQLKPPQPHVTGHITGHINHHTITPEELVAIQTAFGSVPKSHEVWQGVIHQLPWLFLNREYGEDDRNEIVRLVKLDSELDAALERKYNELLRRFPHLRQLQHQQIPRGPRHQRPPALTPAGYDPSTSLQPTHSPNTRLQPIREQGEQESSEWPTLRTTSRATEMREATTATYGVIGDRRPAALVQPTVTDNMTQPSVVPSSDRPLKAFQFYVKGVNGRDVSDEWKGMPAIPGVDSVRVQVVVDERKISIDELTEKIESWSDGVAKVFKDDD